MKSLPVVPQPAPIPLPYAPGFHLLLAAGPRTSLRWHSTQIRAAAPAAAIVAVLLPGGAAAAPQKLALLGFETRGHY